MGLRSPHYSFILENHPKVDWFEAITENYLDTGGRPRKILEQVRQDYPIVLHGVSLSIGSTDPLHVDYVKKLRAFADAIEPAWISDHLCWTSAGGHNLHDLLPLPYTKEAIRHIVPRVKRTQDLLGRRILLENVSSYVGFRSTEMPEWEFVATIAEKADCGILLDINNIFVNAFNHGFNAESYLQNIPVNRVGQFHLAGHRDMGDYYFDTHDESIRPEVWALYVKALKRFGEVSTLVEWDGKIPDFSTVHAQALLARELGSQAYDAVA